MYATGAMTLTQLAFLRETLDGNEPLRARKKTKTRRAIEDVALDLFAEQGFEATTVEQIAARAEVSTTTFCRYFPTKSDVILGDNNRQVPALQAAVLGRPLEENDLAAVHQALQQAWVRAIDPRRTALNQRAIARSYVLRGVSYDIGNAWIAAIGDALAQRRGLSVADERCTAAARVGLGVFGASVEEWVDTGCSGDLRTKVDDGFDLMAQLCRAWS